MPIILTRPWPDAAWMNPEQLAEAKAKKDAEIAAALEAAGGYRYIDQMTEAEEEAFYTRYDRGMVAGAVIAHRQAPSAGPRRRR